MCKESRPFLTPVFSPVCCCCCTNAFTEPADPISTSSPCWLSLSLTVYNSSLSVCCLCFTLPIDLPQSQTSWLWMLPLRALRGPTSHPVPPLVPWSLCRQRVRGAVVWRVGPQMDIDMSGMRYVMGLGSGLSGPATAVNHNSRRCWGIFLPITQVWKDVIFYNTVNSFRKIITTLC